MKKKDLKVRIFGIFKIQKEIRLHSWMFLGTFRLRVCVSSKKTVKDPEQQGFIAERLGECSVCSSVQRLNDKANFHTLKTSVATEKGKNKSKKMRNT